MSQDTELWWAWNVWLRLRVSNLWPSIQMCVSLSIHLYLSLSKVSWCWSVCFCFVFSHFPISFFLSFPLTPRKTSGHVNVLCFSFFLFLSLSRLSSLNLNSLLNRPPVDLYIWRIFYVKITFVRNHSISREVKNKKKRKYQDESIPRRRSCYYHQW